MVCLWSLLAIETNFFKIRTQILYRHRKSQLLVKIEFYSEKIGYATFDYYFTNNKGTTVPDLFLGGESRVNIEKERRNQKNRH